MKRKRRKVVKMRGSKTHGYGSKKKHRGSGSRGGRGGAGKFDQKKIFVMKYQPWRLEKKRFKSLRQKGKRPEIKAINLRDIEKLSDKDEINLAEFGYDKVLASGNIKRPLIIKAKSFSEFAIKKIEKTGGKAVKVE